MNEELFIRYIKENYDIYVDARNESIKSWTILSVHDSISIEYTDYGRYTIKFNDLEYIFYEFKEFFDFINNKNNFIEEQNEWIKEIINKINYIKNYSFLNFIENFFLDEEDKNFAEALRKNKNLRATSDGRIYKI